MCLSCFLRHFEYYLKYDYSFYDTYIEIFEKDMIDSKDQYVMKSCVIYHSEGGIIVRLKPRTAEARIISIDEEEPRGIMSLQTLSLLQDLADNDCLVRDLFDITVGISVDENL